MIAQLLLSRFAELAATRAGMPAPGQPAGRDVGVQGGDRAPRPDAQSSSEDRSRTSELTNSAESADELGPKSTVYQAAVEGLSKALQPSLVDFLS